VNSYIPNSGRGLKNLDYRKKWDNDFLAYLQVWREMKYFSNINIEIGENKACYLDWRLECSSSRN
jgi:hypothetical protein